ncbi:hypothetical protein [Parvibaculum sp.]|uniref:hypothetical protein n=1 Tax=Parvibaculum sp. TaxID=2024848 RepID=UPI00320DED03
MTIAFEKENTLADLAHTMKALHTIGEDAEREVDALAETAGASGAFENPLPTMRHFIVVAAEAVRKLQEMEARGA